MATQSTSVENLSIDDLLSLSAVLKRELVEYARSPRFARRLNEALSKTADLRGYLDETAAILAIDHFVLRHRLPGGRTVLERFVTQRRPPLADAEREMLLGWRDVVEGCFEARGFDGDAVLLHNLMDDLKYPVYSNMGRKALANLRTGKFLVGRIVPLHPATDSWLLSGPSSVFAKRDSRQIAQVAVEQLTAHPEVLRRNPDMLRKAWEIQAEQRADFIDQVGADMIVLPPDEAQETLREHVRRQQQRAMANLDARKAKRAAKTGPAPEQLAQLPEELLEADTVALVYDEVEGLNFYYDFGRLDALFADPELARDRTYLTQLREFLDDESVAPMAIRRLVQRHPDGTNPVFRALLGKPDFSWERDGEKLLQRHKKTYFDREPTPSISTIGERLTELLGAG